MKTVPFLLASCVLVQSWAVETPYRFRDRLVTVHRTDRRDVTLRPTADEYVLSNGVQIAVPAGAPALVHRARPILLVAA